MDTHPPRSRRHATLTILAIWCLLQLPRLIAIPLISDVANGRDDSAWMYPAILDVVVAVAAIPVAWLLWSRRGLLALVAGVAFLVVSIIDHGDAVTAALLAPAPHVFGGPNGSMSPKFVPAIQAVGDLAALWLLTKESTRAHLGVPSSTRAEATRAA